MSTRRARIKAVASLPVRRKNNEKKEISDNKPNTPKQVPATPKNCDENINEIEKIVTDSVTETQLGQTPKSDSSNLSRTPKLISRTPGTPKSKKGNTPQLFSPPSNVASSPTARTITSISNYDKTQTPSNSTIPDNYVINATDFDVAVPEVPKVSTPHVCDTPIANQKDVENIICGISQISSYNPPSVPESVTEDAVFDGIVPLQAKKNVPKPLDLLKNEIISENAEVLFDPIIPLPSPSKVRPKLRPVPRLPFRRNSIQGSASESEDESRRALLNSGTSTPAPQRQRLDSFTAHSMQHATINREPTRTRNDSICSNISLATAPPQTPSASACKDKLISKSRRTEMSRRMSALRRKQRRENLPRDTLTMYDLIFYNPTTNPIVHEDVPGSKEPPNTVETVQKVPEETAADPTEDVAPVPQLKVGPNGEIILDEQSLVIKQTSGGQLSSSVVHESELSVGSRGRYTRGRRAADWSDAETVRFYRALGAVGTDFTMMLTMFPDRTRRDLKVKFKKEEKLNGVQVDKALRSHIEWDALKLESEFKEERRLAAEKLKKEKAAVLEEKRLEKARLRAARSDGFRHSKGFKAIESAVDGVKTHPLEAASADDLIRRAFENKNAQKQRSIPKTTKPVPNLTPIHKLPVSNSNSPYVSFFNKNKTPTLDLSKIVQKTPNATLPQNIEQGSLVVLTVSDPKEPTKKMLQTYISHGAGRLTPVALPSTLLNSVVSYMKKSTPKSTSNSSPQLTSPSSVASHDSRSSVIQINPSPSKRKKHDSYTITPL